MPNIKLVRPVHSGLPEDYAAPFDLVTHLIDNYRKLYTKGSGSSMGFTLRRIPPYMHREVRYIRDLTTKSRTTVGLGCIYSCMIEKGLDILEENDAIAAIREMYQQFVEDADTEAADMDVVERLFDHTPLELSPDSKSPIVKFNFESPVRITARLGDYAGFMAISNNEVAKWAVAVYLLSYEKARPGIHEKVQHHIEHLYKMTVLRRQKISRWVAKLRRDDNDEDSD